VSPDKFPVTTAAGNQMLPRVAFGQGNYLILWSHKLLEGAGDCMVKGRFFTTSGQPVGPEFEPFATAGANRPMLAGVIDDGTQFLAVGALGVVTSPFQITSGDVYGTFIAGPSSSAAAIAPAPPANASPLSDQALPKPPLQFGCGNSGVSVANGCLQMTLSGPVGALVVVEACTGLTNPVWQPVQTNILTSGQMEFRDPTWTNSPSRFYRLRSP
jgi:hypothetical protein